MWMRTRRLFLRRRFYNPVQDALARVFTGLRPGYSTSLSYEEFTRLVLTAVVPTIGDPFGDELAVLLTNPGGGFTFLSASPSSANHGRLSCARGRLWQTEAAVLDSSGRRPALRRHAALDLPVPSPLQQVQCDIDVTPGLVLGIGALTDSLPSWLADGTGFWTTFWGRRCYHDCRPNDRR